MKAGIVNNSNVDAIKQYIDQDMPVILLGKNLAGERRSLPRCNRLQRTG
jgi:hypothetical protein